LRSCSLLIAKKNPDTTRGSDRASITIPTETIDFACEKIGIKIGKSKMINTKIIK